MSTLDKWVVRHYTSEQNPVIKRDGIELDCAGATREQADEIARVLNAAVDPTKWVVTHNGTTGSSDTIFGMLKAAQFLRTPEEMAVANEKLHKAVEAELAEARTSEYVLAQANLLIEDAKSAGFVVQIGKKYLDPYAMGNYVMEATVYPDHASHRKPVS